MMAMMADSDGRKQNITVDDGKFTEPLAKYLEII